MIMIIIISISIISVVVIVVIMDILVRPDLKSRTSNPTIPKYDPQKLR